MVLHSAKDLTAIGGWDQVESNNFCQGFFESPTIVDEAFIEPYNRFQVFYYS